MAETTVRIGIAGFGVVGAGVAKILLEQADYIAQRTGLRLEPACVVDKDTKTQRPVQLPSGLLTSDMDRLLSDPSISIAVELVGGTTAARDIELKMLKAGKDVVTANKALLAEHGPELFAAAKAAGRCIAFEASCAGGIPIISALRTGLAANRITALYGILNGTCNYILTNMTKHGLDFKTALAQARKKGYAEADPTLDINGTDSAHKLAILAALAFGCTVNMKDIHIEGIEKIQIDDIRKALEMGYVLKLLAIGQQVPDKGISLRVHPSFIQQDSPLARVDGPFNAISVFGNAVGNTLYFGSGAGMMPTASAIVADIIEIALGNSQKLFNTMPMAAENQPGPLIRKIDEIDSRFYLKLMAKDQPGVFARYGQILSRHNISISGAIQHEGLGPDNTVPVVITTHPTQQKNMIKAIREIASLDVIGDTPVCIRIVDIPEDKE